MSCGKSEHCLLIETVRKSAIFFLPWRFQMKTDKISEKWRHTLKPQVIKSFEFDYLFTHELLTLNVSFYWELHRGPVPEAVALKH